MDGKVNTGGGGLGFFAILTLIFITLKLLHVVDWSWFWVLSPAIFSILLGMLIFLIIMVVINRH